MQFPSLPFKDEPAFTRENTFCIRRQKTRLWQEDFKLPHVKKKNEEAKKNVEKRLIKSDKPSGHPFRIRRERPRSCELTSRTLELANFRLPEIVVHCKIANLKQRVLPQERTIIRQSTNVASVTNVVSTHRRPERERRGQIKGWDNELRPDDGITIWMKRQKLMESKREQGCGLGQASVGTKKHPALLDTEHHIPITHRCPNIDDLDIFMKDSLHNVFSHTSKKTTEPANSESNGNNVALKYTKNSKFGIVTPAGFVEKTENKHEEIGPDIDSYRHSKLVHGGAISESKSLQDLQTKEQLERSNSYLKFKRFLKFSKKERISGKNGDEEDEGYCSKTSSAEHKTGSESDGEDSGANVGNLDKSRMFSSMVDLTDLPSNAKDGDLTARSQGSKSFRFNDLLSASKAKFSYTHQAPSVCQLPGPGVSYNLRVENRKHEQDDNSWSYAKLKRNKELNRCYNAESMPHQQEQSTVYNIDNMKPMALVLRKISIQNAEENYPSIYHTEMQPTCIKAQPADVRHPSRNSSHNNSSRTGSRAESSMSQERSSPTRAESALSRVSSPRAQSRVSSPTKRNYGSTITESHQHASGNYQKRSPVRDVRVVNENNQKEGMWSPEVSYIDKNSASYSFGDLLPAMEKNIYTKLAAEPKFVRSEEERTQNEYTTTELIDMNCKPADDGYILLKKGLDLLTNVGHEKPTLGPPAFRPNQSRHPLMRSLTVVVGNSRQESTPRDRSPTSSRARPARTSSIKGSHQGDGGGERETQRKLKEAFSEFYKNRPKEIGKEFRRMQTMWKA
ncbi:uncharacterized protein LOC128213594 isoform X3 [Mya arenaria]|uniref:uncharacterized protein LOC128213594 isoform X3 n=1 Tax=Mya arenaria TaxID=6604 RepID=UPI0022E00A6D|nr:uncharacterized protein LOC128213594 isoform X3 [Mya arenaria]